MKDRRRLAHNEAFVERLLQRRPELAAGLRKKLEGAPGAEAQPVDRAKLYETIVDEERPVMFVKDGEIDTTDVHAKGVEARELTRRGGWVQVRLASGAIGWVPEVSALKVGD